MARFQRQRGEGQAAHAATLELFYDLVFVFAITQVSHTLLEELTWEVAGQQALVLLVVWWSWNYTTWVTNELDTESPVVRGVMVALMLGSLLMAVAIPEAWGTRAGLFVGAYLFIQLGRHAFLTFGAGTAASPERARAGRILIWFAIAGIPWVLGAIADGEARTLLWLLALAIDYAGPITTFWLPGRSGSITDWDVETSHFAERFGLFLIIALGESIVITGATTSEVELTTQVVIAFGVAFLTTAALWWLYFAYVARVVEKHLEMAGDRRTALARDAFTYLHVVLVAGIIVSAVGDELVLAHPDEPLKTPELIAVVAGPAIYLVAHALVRLRMAGTLSWRRVGGAVGCVLVAVVLQDADALVVGGAVLLVLIAVIVLEEEAGRRRRRRGELGPLEKLAAARA